MYVVEQWNGLMGNSYTCVVAGFPTLEEASDWCYAQSPTRRWCDKDEFVSTKEAFKILYIEGQSVTVIPYPWRVASK